MSVLISKHCPTPGPKLTHTNTHSENRLQRLQGIIPSSPFIDVLLRVTGESVTAEDTELLLSAPPPSPVKQNPLGLDALQVALKSLSII